MLLRRVFAASGPFAQKSLTFAVVTAVFFCAAFLLAAPDASRAEEETTSQDTVYEPAHTRLALPENWGPSGPWAENPAAGEQPGGLLFSGEAHAPTGEAVTKFTLNLLPPIAIPSEAFPQMTAAEQQHFCDSLLKSFSSAFTKQAGVAPTGTKAMIKRLNGWYTVMLTARFISGDTDIIINQVAYSLPDRMLSLTFYTDAPLIAVMAPDMVYILDNFQPDSRITPREATPREPKETLDDYLARLKTVSQQKTQP